MSIRYIDTETLCVEDAAGRPVAGGLYGAGEAGRVTLSELPEGRFALLVQAPGTATTEIEVASPDEVSVPLREAGGLRVRVSDLEGSGTAGEIPSPSEPRS